MSHMHLGMMIAGLVSLAGVGADSLLKVASRHQAPLANRWFIAGMVLSVAFALGWLMLMRYMKLATAAAIYAVASAVVLAIVGVVFFDERLTAAEIAGLCMAIGSVALLSRFAA